MAPEVSLALRRGWTTRACAAAASRVAFAAMLTGRFPDPVAVRLPRGGAATFPLALAPLSSTSARAGVVKDAGHDCGIDVARAACLGHIAAAIGASSERAVQRLYELPDHALIEMGDFVGGTLKYLRRHPVERLTIAGGFAKLAKLAAGHLDLHSARSQVDIAWLAGILGELGAEPATLATAHTANGAAEILGIASELRERLALAIAGRAREVALATICGKTAIEVAIVDLQGSFLARVGM